MFPPCFLGLGRPCARRFFFLRFSFLHTPQQGAGKLMVVSAGAAVDAGRGAARHLGLGAGVLKVNKTGRPAGVYPGCSQ